MVDIVIVVNACFVHLFLALRIVGLLLQHQFVVARLVIDIVGYIATLAWWVGFLVPLLTLPYAFYSVEFGDFEDGPALSLKLLWGWHGIMDSSMRLSCGVRGWG